MIARRLVRVRFVNSQPIRRWLANRSLLYEAFPLAPMCRKHLYGRTGLRVYPAAKHAATGEDQRVYLPNGIDHGELQLAIKWCCGRRLPHSSLPSAGGSAIGLSATDAYGQSLGQ